MMSAIDLPTCLSEAIHQESAEFQARHSNSFVFTHAGFVALMGVLQLLAAFAVAFIGVNIPSDTLMYLGLALFPTGLITIQLSIIRQDDTTTLRALANAIFRTVIFLAFFALLGATLMGIFVPLSPH